MKYGYGGKDPGWKGGELTGEATGRGMDATNKKEKREYTECSML